MTNRTRASWLVYALGALCIGAVVTAILIVGPTSQSAAVQRRVVTVSRGVVQSTVSGSGNIQAAIELDLGFKTSGVVQHIYVSTGQHVVSGQLIAELDPESAEVTLEAARARLKAAEASLAQEEENEGESSGAQAGSGEVNANAAALPQTSTAPTTAAEGTKEASSQTIEGTSAQSTEKTSARKSKQAAQTETKASSEARKQSTATREANLASAKAAVRSDRLSVESDEQSVQDTKLYAPDSGTIVSLGGEVGESVSGGGTSRASSSSESSSSSGSGATAGGGGTGEGSGGSSTSASFAVLSNLSTMQLVVPLSESEIIHVRVGQPAAVTIEALEGSKLAAEVVDVATLPSSSSGVVDYDVTFQLDQLTAGLKPGMSASAEVVVKQAEGVNVPTRAISGGTVTIVHGNSETRRAVVTGLAGDSTTIVRSGLKAGEQIALPVSSTTSSASSALSRLAGRSTSGTLGGGLGGAGAGFAPGGGAFPGGGRGGG